MWGISGISWSEGPVSIFGGSTAIQRRLDLWLTPPEVEFQIPLAVVVPAKDILEIFDILLDKIHIQVPVELPSFPEMRTHESAGFLEVMEESSLDDFMVEARGLTHQGKR